MARPSKLTPQIQTAIADNVLHGATYRDACESVGVAYSTFNEWMKQGREQKSGRFRMFLEAIEAANAQAAVNFTRVIQSAAAKGDWKAAESWLKRRRREDWGDGVDVTSGGEKIKGYIGISPEDWDDKN